MIPAPGFQKPIPYLFEIEERKLYKFDWTKLEDHEIVDLLSQIKGVGIWTVQMILIFELNRPDVFPSLDLAIQYAIKDLSSA